ncbi:MAG: hypothetical protein PSU94_16275 [Lacunisphaera sp.]|nr:hypothetical protein [Lacunisphaera sp.]
MPPPARLFACLAGPTLLVALAGCAATPRSDWHLGPAYGQVVVSYLDDYDYFPAYETYYSRNRHDYVFRDGNAWVRRPEPPGVAPGVLLATPSVRMDFHDSPELHHRAVVQAYPGNWKPAGKAAVAADRPPDDRETSERHESMPR